MKHGFDVLVLEARDRSGGRIFSDSSLGIPFGRGANFIHGDQGNPMTPLARNSNSTMVVVDPDKFITYDRHGNRIAIEKIKAFQKKFQKFLKVAKETAQSSQEDISLSAGLRESLKLESLTPL